MNFGSDNQAGASDIILNALLAANTGTAGAYGDDHYTERARQLICETFETDAEVFFVTTGTAANCLALASMARPWQSILCHAQAHIINDELTAPEFFTNGARLIGLDKDQAKLSAQSLREYLAAGSAHPPHNSEPGVLSLSQLNEAGQVYTVEELEELCSIAHQQGLTVHMDGARFANAVAALGCSPADISWKAGVDVLCLGATKNGALAAEAVIFFNKSASKDFIQQRKRSGHLVSKSRWLGAQFCAWLENNHWLQLAQQANQQAALLAEVIQNSQTARLVWPVAGNEIFAILTKADCERLYQAGAIFYPWPTAFAGTQHAVAEDEQLVRLVTAFNTRSDEVLQFSQLLG